MSPIKKLFLIRQKFYYTNNKQYAVFESSICDECGKFALVGKIVDNQLVQVSKLGEDVDYFFLAEEENSDIEDDEDIEEKKLEHYYLCTHCGSIVLEEQIKICHVIVEKMIISKWLRPEKWKQVQDVETVIEVYIKDYI